MSFSLCKILDNRPFRKFVTNVSDSGDKYIHLILLISSQLQYSLLNEYNNIKTVRSNKTNTKLQILCSRTGKLSILGLLAKL